MKQNFIILVFLIVLIVSSHQLVQVQGSRKLKEHHNHHVHFPPRKVNADYQEQQSFNPSNSKWLAHYQNKSISSSSLDNAMTNQAYSGPSQRGSGHQKILINIIPLINRVFQNLNKWIIPRAFGMSTRLQSPFYLHYISSRLLSKFDFQIDGSFCNLIILFINILHVLQFSSKKRVHGN